MSIKAFAGRLHFLTTRCFTMFHHVSPWFTMVHHVILHLDLRCCLAPALGRCSGLAKRNRAERQLTIVTTDDNYCQLTIDINRQLTTHLGKRVEIWRISTLLPSNTRSTCDARICLQRVHTKMTSMFLGSSHKLESGGLHQER